MSRLKNTMYNSTISIGGYIVTTILNYIVRMFFVNYLSVEYLGVNGLFTNIIQILSFAELGIGTALTFAMYKPLAENDEKKLSIIMNLFKKTYFIIGSVIFISGMLLMPFLKYIIVDSPNINNISLIFGLFIFNTAVTYFFSYKKSFLIADQKMYITLLFQYAFQIGLSIVQILILVLTQNYYVYLIIQIVFNVGQNFIVSKYADKHYPFLQKRVRGKLEKNERENIFKNIKGLISTKIGSVIVLGTDNIIISSFIGISAVGVYSNYTLITKAVKTIIAQVFSSATASVGNLNVSDDNNKLANTYWNMSFLGYSLTIFCVICLYFLINPFIKMTLGNEYILNNFIIVAIMIEFYLDMIRHPNLIFIEALGLYWYLRYKSVIEAIINLIISIILVNKYGIIGVIIGTICSNLFVCFWLEPYILFKNGLKIPLKKYFGRFAYFTLLGLLIFFIVAFFDSLILGETFFVFLIRLITVVLSTVGLLIFLLKNKNEFKYFVNISKIISGGKK